MAELVDALGSGPSGGNTVEVRVLFWAPSNTLKAAPFPDLMLVLFFICQKPCQMNLSLSYKL